MNITLYMEQNNEEFCAPTLGLHWLKDLMFREGTELSQAHWENAAGMGINQKAIQEDNSNWLSLKTVANNQQFSFCLCLKAAKLLPIVYATNSLTTK